MFSSATRTTTIASSATTCRAIHVPAGNGRELARLRQQAAETAIGDERDIEENATSNVREDTAGDETRLLGIPRRRMIAVGFPDVRRPSCRGTRRKARRAGREPRLAHGRRDGTG